MAASEMLVFVYVNKNSDIPRQIRQSLFLFYRFLSIKYLYTSKIKRSISNSILTMFIIKSIIHTTSDLRRLQTNFSLLEEQLYSFKEATTCHHPNDLRHYNKDTLKKYDFYNLSRQLYKSYLFIYHHTLYGSNHEKIFTENE